MVSGLRVTPGSGKGTCKVSFGGPGGLNGRVIVAAPEEATVTMAADTMEIDLGGKKIYIQATSRKAAELINLASRQTVCVSVLGFNSAGSSPLAPSIEVTPQ